MHICLFDIDGTLLQTGGAGQAAMEAALQAEFSVENPLDDIPTAGRTDRAITADLFESFGIDAEDGARDRFTNAYLSYLPGFLEDREGWVLPGIAELLDRLSPRDDVLLGLLTGNFRQGARLKLEYYGLSHHFEFGGYGDDHFDRDDVAREALAQARKKHDDWASPSGLGNLESKDLWVIGDTPADVRCGRAIGAKVVAVGTGLYAMEELEAAQPDYLWADFADPEPLLALFD